MDASAGLGQNGRQNGVLVKEKTVQVIGKDAGFTNKIEMNTVGVGKRTYNLEDNGNKLDKSQQDGFFQRYKPQLISARNYGLIVLYLAYYSYAMFCNFGDEPSIRLTVFTSLGIIYIGWHKLMTYDKLQTLYKSVISAIYKSFKYGYRPKVIRWVLYLVWSALLIYYLVVNVALKNPQKLRSLGGYAVFVLLLVLLSNNKRKINWHSVFCGSALQCLLGYFVIKTNAGKTVITWFSDRLEEFMSYSNVGAEFVFGEAYMKHRFAMQAMPSIIVFFAAIQLLVYLGTIQFIVRTLGKFLAVVLDVSAPEATNACANIFLGGVEAAILVVEYIDTMPTSRLFTLITNWFASCGGSALIQFISFGVPPVYLLAASAMSAPAALVCAKLAYPDTDQIDFNEETADTVLEVVTKKSLSNPGEEAYSNPSFVNETETTFNANDTAIDYNKEQLDTNKGEKHTSANDKAVENMEKETPTRPKRMLPEPKNIGEALLLGTRQGVKLVANIIGNMILALSAVEFVDKSVEWFGNRVNIQISLRVFVQHKKAKRGGITKNNAKFVLDKKVARSLKDDLLSIALSYVFYPLVYIMGVDTEDCFRAGEMLGIRSISNPGIPYQELGKIIDNRNMLNDYITELNETFAFDRDSDIFLKHWNKTLVGGVFSESSELIVSYALCGFASIPMIGMTIGAITVIIPGRQSEVTQLAFRALIAGTIASYLTACVAGLVS